MPLIPGHVRIAAIVCGLLLVALPEAAQASQFVDVVRGRAAVLLKVEGNRAMLSYLKPSGKRHVGVSGAVNARYPLRNAPQVRFRLTYSTGARGRGRWATFPNDCGPYDGPALPYLVTACRGPNGSYWAVQEWPVDLPNFGLPPWTVRQRSLAIHVSHWTGEIASLEVHTDWVYSRRFHEVFGRAMYAGRPVYGFASTRRGAPTDGFGRLIYVDTLDSRYGPGWRRDNAFLPHRPNGVFCNGFFRHGPGRRSGKGASYRVTMIGPGVTPDVAVVVPGLHDFRRSSPADRAYEAGKNRVLDTLAAGGRWCHQH
jgi:hypothetical protein